MAADKRTNVARLAMAMVDCLEWCGWNSLERTSLSAAARVRQTCNLRSMYGTEPDAGDGEERTVSVPKWSDGISYGIGTTTTTMMMER